MDQHGVAPNIYTRGIAEWVCGLQFDAIRAR